MILFRYTVALVFALMATSMIAQKETAVASSTIDYNDSVYQELSLQEWKKFKSFEKKLKLDKKTTLDNNNRLRAYTRDSLQILGVKLMAVKLLEEKKLLNQDISENSDYYAALLVELRKSDIPQDEYLFLEEKMALLKQKELEEKLMLNNWIIGGLIVLCVLLFVPIVVLKAKRKSLVPPELSRQETTIRSLILQGKTNKEIAGELYISLSTVKSHITNIYGKLQVSSRQELFQKHTGTST